MIDEKVMLTPNKNGDTRTAPRYVTFRKVLQASVSHREEVREVMYLISGELKQQGKDHDWTKITDSKQFFKDFKATIKYGDDFTKGKWYQKHVHEERHHPFSYCHEDINLLDIIETIVDCVCAGKSRSGEVRPLEFSTDILEKAVKNTVTLIDNITEVKKENK